MSEAEDDAGARGVVQELLGVDQDQAQAVLDLQLSTMSRERTAAIVSERDHVRAYVGEQDGVRDD